MKSFYKILEGKIKKALNNAGFNEDSVIVNESNRPDLGE